MQIYPTHHITSKCKLTCYVTYGVTFSSTATGYIKLAVCLLQIKKDTAEWDFIRFQTAQQRSSGAGTAYSVLVLVHNVSSWPSILLFLSLNFPIPPVIFYMLLSNLQNWFLLSIQDFVIFITDLLPSQQKCYCNFQNCFSSVHVITKISSKKSIHSRWQG